MGIGQPEEPARVLVLGVGNLLLGDEGAGVWALHALEHCYRFGPGARLVDGGTAGLDLLPLLKGVRQLLVLDAVRQGRPPGSLVRLVDDQVPARLMQTISPHQLGLADLLATARLAGSLPERLMLFGVEPEQVATGLGLSAPVRRAVASLLPQVATELREKGVAVSVRREPSPEKMAAMGAPLGTAAPPGA